MMRHSASAVLAIVLLLVAAARNAVVEADESGNAFGGQKLGIPVYDPEAKRYFAFMRAVSEPPYMAMWESVEKQAASQLFKGVKGRLAIVDSIEVHDFLLRNFRPNQYQYVWIGLRYFCKAKKLEWSDGRVMQPGSFQMWDKPWYRDAYTCSDRNNPIEYAPVAYTPEMHAWIASGRHKAYDWYFVEWPTGKP
jgi:hypothetical protein